MSNGNRVENAHEPTFDAARAEFFEAIGHPVRVRIIRLLGRERLGFAGLKKELGIESSGHLSFHLDKLSRMVVLSQDGLYGLTAEGYDALRMVDTVTQSTEDSARLTVRPPGKPGTGYTVLMIVLIVGLVILAGFAAYQQVQIAGVSNRLQSTVTSTKTVTGQGGWSSATGGTEVVNGVQVFFNGTGGLTLAVNNNPIPPEQTATVTVIYPVGTGFGSQSTIRFTLVNAQGLEATDQIDLFGGLSSTTTTTASK